MPDAPSTTGARPHAKYDRLIEVAGQHPAIQTAVAHPCDAVSLESAVEAARLGLLKPILVGPAARLQDVAHRAELDIGAFEIVDSQHSHDSAAKAVELVRAGRAEALMKGSLHTDELMGAVVSRDFDLFGHQILEAGIRDVGIEDALCKGVFVGVEVP